MPYQQSMILIEKLYVLRQVTCKKCLIGIVAIIFRRQAQTVDYTACICVNYKNWFIGGVKQDRISGFRTNAVDSQKLRTQYFCIQSKHLTQVIPVGHA